MNRTTALTAAGLLLVALPLAACTSSKPAEPAQRPAGGATAAPTAPAASSMAAPAKASKNYNLQFIQGVAGDEFYITMQCGMEAEAAKLGVSVKTQGAQKFDPTLQKPILDSVAAGKPDAILIAPTDVTAMQAPLNAAAEAGTKIVLVDTTVEDPSIAVSAIASDNEGGGRAAFEAIKQLNPDGGKVMVMSVNPGISTTDARAKGFEDAVKEDPKFQYLGVQYSKNEPAIAANLIGAALQKDPDLVGVFAANLFSAEGTATGVRQAGKQEQVKIVSFDAGPNQVKALKDGTVQALVAQQPALIGQYGVDAAVTALEGGAHDAQGANRLRDHHQGQCRRRGSCRDLQVQLLTWQVGVGALADPHHARQATPTLLGTPRWIDHSLEKWRLSLAPPQESDLPRLGHLQMLAPSWLWPRGRPKDLSRRHTTWAVKPQLSPPMSRRQRKSTTSSLRRFSCMDALTS